MEAELIEWLRTTIPSHRRLGLPLGDDAAVINIQDDRQMVVSTDMLTDGVDFVVGAVEPDRIGHKCLAVNLSDLAAMAAEPVAAVISLALPRTGGLALAKSLYEGILPLAAEFDLALAGGDTNGWDGPLVVSITILGSSGPAGALTRSGARPNDRILVTGRFGGSILGRHLDVQPRIREAQIVASSFTLHAVIDVSDGLACDLNHLCVESNVGAIVDLDRVPIHRDAEKLASQQADGRTPLDHALSDGEDFELVLAVPPSDAARILADQPTQVAVSDIGHFTKEPGLWSRSSAENELRPLPPGGYQH